MLLVISSMTTFPFKCSSGVMCISRIKGDLLNRMNRHQPPGMVQGGDGAISRAISLGLKYNGHASGDISASTTAHRASLNK